MFFVISFPTGFQDNVLFSYLAKERQDNVLYIYKSSREAVNKLLARDGSFVSGSDGKCV